MRVPADYYEWQLEARRAALGAPSIFHLCKSMVMVSAVFTNIRMSSKCWPT